MIRTRVVVTTAHEWPNDLTEAAAYAARHAVGCVIRPRPPKPTTACKELWQFRPGPPDAKTAAKPLGRCTAAQQDAVANAVDRLWADKKAATVASQAIRELTPGTRIVRPADLLAPFAMCAPLARSDYYGASALPDDHQLATSLPTTILVG